MAILQCTYNFLQKFIYIFLLLCVNSLIEFFLKILALQLQIAQDFLQLTTIHIEYKVFIELTKIHKHYYSFTMNHTESASGYADISNGLLRKNIHAIF